jgi:hypothetical protein
MSIDRLNPAGVFALPELISRAVVSRGRTLVQRYRPGRLERGSA